MTNLSRIDAHAALGSEVRRLRLSKGLTQAQLATLIGVRQKSVSRDEQGHVQGIPADRLNGYIEALGLERDYVMALLDGSALPSERDETLAAQLDAVSAIPQLDEPTRREFVRILRRRRALSANVDGVEPQSTTDVQQ